MGSIGFDVIWQLTGMKESKNPTDKVEMKMAA